MTFTGPPTRLSRILYLSLAGLTLVTILVSIQPSIALRQVRNLTILASYAIGIALLFTDRWVRPAAVWAGVGLVSGLLYYGYEAWAMKRAKREGPAESGSPTLSTIALGVFAWPLALPEVIEATLADTASLIREAHLLRRVAVDSRPNAIE